MAPKKERKKERDSDRERREIARRLALAINVFSKLKYPLDLKGTVFCSLAVWMFLNTSASNTTPPK